jgi:hypothetical protein
MFILAGISSCLAARPGDAEMGTLVSDISCFGDSSIAYNRMARIKRALINIQYHFNIDATLGQFA